MFRCAERDSFGRYIETPRAFRFIERLGVDYISGSITFAQVLAETGQSFVPSSQVHLT